MHNNPPEKTESLFFELAGDLRLSMLLKLFKHKYRLSQLSGLTSYGKSIVFLIPGYEFLLQNKQYFIEHSIEELPLKFIQRIGSLQNSEIVFGVMAILQRWKTLYWNSKLYIKEIMSQVPLDLIETVSNKIETGIKFSYIFSKDTIIPKGR